MLLFDAKCCLTPQDFKFRAKKHSEENDSFQLHKSLFARNGISSIIPIQKAFSREGLLYFTNKNKSFRKNQYPNIPISQYLISNILLSYVAVALGSVSSALVSFSSCSFFFSMRRKIRFQRFCQISPMCSDGTSVPSKLP